MAAGDAAARTMSGGGSWEDAMVAGAVAADACAHSFFMDAGEHDDSVRSHRAHTSKRRGAWRMCLGSSCANSTLEHGDGEENGQEWFHLSGVTDAQRETAASTRKLRKLDRELRAAESAPGKLIRRVSGWRRAQGKMAALNAFKLLSQQSARSLPLISAFYQPDAPSSSVDAAPAGADDFDHDDEASEAFIRWSSAFELVRGRSSKTFEAAQREIADAYRLAAIDKHEERLAGAPVRLPAMEEEEEAEDNQAAITALAAALTFRDYVLQSPPTRADGAAATVVEAAAQKQTEEASMASAQAALDEFSVSRQASDLDLVGTYAKEDATERAREHAHEGASEQTKEHAHEGASEQSPSPAPHAWPRPLGHDCDEQQHAGNSSQLEPSFTPTDGTGSFGALRDDFERLLQGVDRRALLAYLLATSADAAPGHVEVPTAAPAAMAAKLTTASFTGSIKNLLSGVGMQVLPRHRNRTMPKPGCFQNHSSAGSWEVWKLEHINYFAQRS